MNYFKTRYRFALTLTATLFALLPTLSSCSKSSVSDPTPPFTLDPHQPFHLEFGRGSGWDGLAAILLDQSGHIIISRQPTTVNTNWTQAELQLSPDVVSAIVNQINSEKLTHLDRVYSANINDGTQWIFWLTQGAHQKSIYFDNNFPTPITRFATALDAILKPALDEANWKSAEPHLTDALWKSIK